MTIPTTRPEPVSRELDALFCADRFFWSPGHVAAFLAACWLRGGAPGLRAAREWKRCRGTAFAVWRELTGGERRRLMEAHRAAA